MRELMQKVTQVVLLAGAGVIAYQFRLYVRLSGVLLYCVGFVFLIYLIANLSADTTLITNTAFAMVASLAALSFPVCRAITEPPEHQDRIRYAGERFFHAAVLLLFASLLRYGAFKLWSGGQPATPFGYVVLIDVTGFLVAYSFGMALSASHAGGCCGSDMREVPRVGALLRIGLAAQQRRAAARGRTVGASTVAQAGIAWPRPLNASVRPPCAISSF